MVSMIGSAEPAGVCRLRRVRQALTTLVFLLPPSKLKNRLLRRLGHVVPDTAVVGINLVRRVDRFELGEGALIHHFNMFRDLRLVKLGVGCRIMLFNQVVGDSGYEPGATQTADADSPGEIGQALTIDISLDPPTAQLTEGPDGPEPIDVTATLTFTNTTDTVMDEVTLTKFSTGVAFTFER